ncbi:hypothetical protein [Kitasatospora sp. SolWspMP-SS2h]|uniref:hypothetical protein n=1 Tax=Kitasatospora sp. SolWspMP-SS2h TaxID=1305729 RepID=UPI000DBABDD4|nr:hypothetical protein [Kitasatospora sp. SolWspMP-SS2h]
MNAQRIASAATAALLLAACSSGTTVTVKPLPTPAATDLSAAAQELRALDQAAGATTEAADAYDRAFAALAARCVEQPRTLEAEVHSTAAQLKALGSETQTRLTVLNGIAAAIPPAYPRSNCAPYLDTYVAAQQATGTIH